MERRHRNRPLKNKIPLCLFSRYRATRSILKSLCFYHRLLLLSLFTSNAVFFFRLPATASRSTPDQLKEKSLSPLATQTQNMGGGGEKTQFGKYYRKLPWAIQIRLHCVPLEKIYTRNLFHTWHSSLSSSCCSLLIWEHQFSPSSMFTPGHNNAEIITITKTTSKLCPYSIAHTISDWIWVKYWVHYTELPVCVWSFD